MIRIGAAYALAGLIFAAIAAGSLADASNPRRWRNGLFWGLFAASFVFGDRLGDVGNGVLVLALVGLGAAGLGRGASAPMPERGPGARLFLPILVVPAVALGGSIIFKTWKIGGDFVVDPKQATVIALALGVVLALGAAMAMLRAAPAAPVREARRLMDQVGWAAILPQLLAALGAVFALAGVGRAVGQVLAHGLPMDNRLVAVAAYGLGMAGFTMIMGNAFAALPVMVAGIGAPVLAGRFGGDPTILGAMGMLSGYCGTLMTPMAAHNIVPTALMDLPAGAVIRAQAPTALVVLAANIALMDLLAFRTF